jgi:hypothetical protein
LQGFNPNKPVPPPGPAIPPSPSVDLPPLVPIPTGKNCNLNIWRDASGKVINVVKVK